MANGEHPVVQPYGPAAGDRAVLAARNGRRGLELRDVFFAYPARPDVLVLRVSSVSGVGLGMGAVLHVLRVMRVGWGGPGCLWVSDATARGAAGLCAGREAAAGTWPTLGKELSCRCTFLTSSLPLLCALRLSD